MLEGVSTIFVRTTSQTYIRSIYHSEGFRTKMNLSSYKNELKVQNREDAAIYEQAELSANHWCH